MIRIVLRRAMQETMHRFPPPRQAYHAAPDDLHRLRRRTDGASRAPDALRAGACRGGAGRRQARGGRGDAGRAVAPAPCAVAARQGRGARHAAAACAARSRRRHGAMRPDDPAYNQPVRLPYPASAEPLWRDDRVYDLIVVLGYNDDPVVAGAGFGHLPASGAAGLCADRRDASPWRPPTSSTCWCCPAGGMRCAYAQSRGEPRHGRVSRSEERFADTHRASPRIGWPVGEVGAHAHGELMTGRCVPRSCAAGQSGVRPARPAAGCTSIPRPAGHGRCGRRR